MRQKDQRARAVGTRAARPNACCTAFHASRIVAHLDPGLDAAIADSNTRYLERNA